MGDFTRIMDQKQMTNWKEKNRLHRSSLFMEKKI